jgi:hypothetical protein
MTNNKNILINFNRTHWNVNWKVDIVQNLALQNIALPRNTHISGHFHLKTTINSENSLSNRLIF